MEIKEDDMDQEANTEQDFHFKVPTAEDEDDMDDLSSDEGEVEEFIKDYHIEEEDDVRTTLLIFLLRKLWACFLPPTIAKSRTSPI